MAIAKVVHSTDACTIIFEGDPANPEPPHGIIKFPGGHAEVARCSDGSYWGHLAIERPDQIIESRIDFRCEPPIRMRDIPDGEHVEKIAIRIDGRRVTERMEVARVPIPILQIAQLVRTALAAQVGLTDAELQSLSDADLSRLEYALGQLKAGITHARKMRAEHGSY